MGLGSPRGSGSHSGSGGPVGAGSGGGRRNRSAFGAFGNGSGGSSGSVSSLLFLFFHVLVDLLHLRNQEMRSTIPTFRRTLKVCQIPLSWEVGIHGSDPSLPLHTLISRFKSRGSGNEVR